MLVMEGTLDIPPDTLLSLQKGKVRLAELFSGTQLAGNRSVKDTDL